MKAKMYLHGCKDSNRRQGEELGLTEEQLENFKYALYEVEFDVEIDDKGNCEIEAVDGDLLVDKELFESMESVAEQAEKLLYRTRGMDLDDALLGAAIIKFKRVKLKLEAEDESHSKE